VIVVDTSVWVCAFRSAISREAEVLGALLDEDEVALAVPARIELLGGASKDDRVRLRRLLSALPVLYPTDDTWKLMDAWIDRAAPAGQRFGFGDLLIGALAHETGSLVWSLDGDFSRMASLGFVAIYEP
jgi:predicted nucleic acid-binding protein